MPVSKNASPNLRYFLARLKPLGRVTFWVPLGILALVGLGLWQYRNQTTNGVVSSPAIGGKLLPETQWVGKEVPATSLKPQIIDPNTGLPATPTESASNDPNTSQQLSPAPATTPNSNLNPPNSSQPNNIPSDPSLSNNYNLNPRNQVPLQGQPNPVNPPQQNRNQTLFPPLLPTRQNGQSPSASRFSVPRNNAATGFTPPSQTESPLQRAINRTAAQSYDSPPAASSPVQNTTVVPPVQTAPQPSLYSNSYQPPVYQPPGTNNNYNYRGGNGNGYPGTANTPTQPQQQQQQPAPGGGGFQSGF